MAAEKRKNRELPLLLKDYINSPEAETAPENLDNFFDEENFVPKEFLPLLR